MKLALAPLALVAGLALTGCGSDDSASEAADSTASSSSGSSSSSGGTESGAAGPFCEALSATATVQDGADVVALRESLESTGIPEEAGPEAASGLEVYLDILGEVDEDATTKDLAQMQDPGLSKDEQADVDAMVSYATTTCTAGAGQAPSEAPEAPESE